MLCYRFIDYIKTGVMRNMIFIKFAISRPWVYFWTIFRLMQQVSASLKWGNFRIKLLIQWAFCISIKTFCRSHSLVGSFHFVNVRSFLYFSFSVNTTNGRSYCTFHFPWFWAESEKNGSPRTQGIPVEFGRVRSSSVAASVWTGAYWAASNRETCVMEMCLDKTRSLETGYSRANDSCVTGS